MSKLLRVLDEQARRIVLFAAVLSVVVSSGVAIAEGSRLRFQDERAYVELARSIADRGEFASFEYLALAASLAGRPYTAAGPAPETAYRPPVYPFLLGGLRAVGAGVVVMRVAGAVLLGLAVWLLWLVLVPVLSRAAAALACVVTAVWPALVFTSVSLYPQALSLVLVLLVLLAMRRATAAASAVSRVAWAAGAGLAWGALLLDVPAVAAVVVLTGAIALLVHRPRGVLLALLTAIACAAMLPAIWAVRNSSAIDAAVPVSTNTGLNLLLGNSPKATATSGTTADIRPYARTVAARHLDEPGANSFYTDAATGWARRHPGRAVVLYIEKVLYHFSPINKLRTHAAQSKLESALAVVTLVPVLVLFVLRLVLVRRFPLRSGEWVLVALVLVNALVQAIAFPRVRFRVPFDPFMLAVVAGLAVHLVSRTARAAVR